MSPNVVAVGGTFLTVDSNNNYVRESGWSSGGGGVSYIETKPSYQQGLVTQTSTNRTVPDVAMDSDPNSGVAVYDSYDFPGSSWVKLAGRVWLARSGPELSRSLIRAAQQFRSSIERPLSNASDALQFTLQRFS